MSKKIFLRRDKHSLMNKKYFQALKSHKQKVTELEEYSFITNGGTLNNLHFQLASYAAIAAEMRWSVGLRT